MIEEVPIVDEPTVEATEPELVPEPEVAKRGRGRPPGAKGKAKPAKAAKAAKPPPTPESEPDEPPTPKPKKKKAAPKKRPVSSDSEEEAPRKRRRVEPPDTQCIALEVMQLLSDHHAHRATARRNKYAGWFQN